MVCASDTLTTSLIPQRRSCISSSSSLPCVLVVVWASKDAKSSTLLRRESSETDTVSLGLEGDEAEAARSNVSKSSSRCDSSISSRETETPWWWWWWEMGCARSSSWTETPPRTEGECVTTPVV